MAISCVGVFHYDLIGALLTQARDRPFEPAEIGRLPQVNDLGGITSLGSEAGYQKAEIRRFRMDSENLHAGG